jgi:hypothetical protein
VKAEGTVSDTQTALWTPTEKCRVQSVRFHSSANGQTVRVYVRKEGKTARRVMTYVLQSDEAGIPIGEIDWEKGDSIEAIATTNGAVDYTVNFVPLKDANYLVHGGFRPSKYNSQGAEVIIASSSIGTGVGTTGYIAGGTSTASLGTVFFVDSNSISFGLSNGSMTAKFSVTNTFSQSVQTQHVHDVTLAGNSTSAGAGFILISSGTMTMAGGSNITLSQNGNAVTIFGAAGASAGIAGIANSETTYTSGTVQLSAAGMISILSSFGQQFQISAPFQSTETAAYALDGTANSIIGLGTSSQVLVNSIKFRPVGNISIGFDLFDVIEFSVGTAGGGGGGSESIGISNLGNTSGNSSLISADGFRYILVGDNNITLNQSVDGGRKSGTLSISGLSFVNSNNVTFGISAGSLTASVSAASTGQSVTLGISTFGNTSGTNGFVSGDAIRYIFVGTNAVGLSQSIDAGNKSATLTINVAAQTNQNLSLFAAGNTASTSTSSVLNASSIILNGAGGNSIGFSNGSIIFSGPVSATTISGVTSANVIGTRGTRFALEDHQHVGVYSVGVSNIGGTSGNTGLLPGQMVLAGGNNITLSVGTAAGSLQTVTISAASQTNQTVGMYALGQTTQNSSTTFDARTLGSFSADGLLTVGFSNGTIQLSAAHLIAGTQTAGGASAVSLVNSNGVSFGMSNSSNITANVGFLSYWANQIQLDNTATTTVANSTSYIAPFFLPLPLSASYLRMPVIMSAQTTTIGTTINTTITMSYLQTIYAMIYSQGTGGSSRSLMSVTSSSIGWTQVFKYQQAGVTNQATHSYQISYGIEGGSTQTFAASAGQTASTQTLQSSIASDFSGLRYLDIPFGNSLSAGAYWFAYGLSSTTSTQGTNALTNLAFTHAVIVNTNQPLTNVGTGNFGNMGAATATSQDILFGIGSYTSNAIGPVAALAMSNVSSNAKRINPYYQFVRQA